MVVDPGYLTGPAPVISLEQIAAQRTGWLGMFKADCTGGIIFPTAAGDGIFPVFAVYEDGEMVRVEIDFASR